MTKTFLTRAFALPLALALPLAMAVPMTAALTGPALADGFSNAKGSWSGGGTIKHRSGRTEKVRCSARGSGGSSSLRLSGSCRSAGRTYPVSMALKRSGSSVSGSVRGRRVKGSVSGSSMRVSGGGAAVRVSGRRMSISGSNNRGSLRVSLRK